MQVRILRPPPFFSRIHRGTPILTEPDVPEDGEHHDHDADDVEDVHACPPPVISTLVVTNPARSLAAKRLPNRESSSVLSWPAPVGTRDAGRPF